MDRGPDVGISSKAMLIMNSFVNDSFDRIMSEAGKLVRYNKKVTLSACDVQTAVRLVLPGELAKHAISEGTKSRITCHHQRQPAKVSTGGKAPRKTLMTAAARGLGP